MVIIFTDMKGDKTVNVHHIKPFLFNHLIVVLSPLSLSRFFKITQVLILILCGRGKGDDPA